VAGFRVSVLGSAVVEGPARPDGTTAPPRDADTRFAPGVRDLIPTPLITARSRRPIEIRPMPSRPWWRGIWCLGLIAGYFFHRIFAKWAGRLDDEQDARDARRLFERLSGMWIKLGQLLSLKTDIMSEPMVRELAALQYEVRGFPSDVAMNVLAADLGVPIATVFSRVEAQPFAAASICQVHRGTLRDSDRAVVIKIMRPDVQRAFESDLRLLRFLVFLINILGQGGRLNLREGLSELASVMREETDYTHELMNLRQMRKKLKSHGIIVPRAYPRVSGRRVLVMEEIPGVLMSEYIRQRREDLSTVETWERQNGIEPDRVARLLLTTAMRQILEDNLFHGDLHPGNIILLSDNRIALIDFGTVGRLPSRAWLGYREMTASIALGDYERAADYMLLLGDRVPAYGVARLRSGLAEIMRQWEARSQLETLPYAQRSMASASVDTARLMADYNVPTTWALLRVGRALNTLDASLQVLAPDGNFMRLYKAYFRDRYKRRSSLSGRMRTLRGTIGQLSKIGGDIEVLLSPQIRQLAFRERGMVGGATRVKISVLSTMRRGALGLAALAGLALVINKHSAFVTAHVPARLDPIVVEPMLWIKSGVPDLPYLQWLMIVGGLLFLAHLLGVPRRSLASSD
jgi:ubiquinone biosynthesis protein